MDKWTINKHLVEVSLIAAFLFDRCRCKPRQTGYSFHFTWALISRRKDNKLLISYLFRFIVTGSHCVAQAGLQTVAPPCLRHFSAGVTGSTSTRLTLLFIYFSANCAFFRSAPALPTKTEFALLQPYPAISSCLPEVEWPRVTPEVIFLDPYHPYVSC